jgi:chorismate mutase
MSNAAPTRTEAGPDTEAGETRATTPGPDAVDTGRARIDELDRAIIEMILARVEVSGEIQRARIAAGGGRVQLARETEIIARYRQALGKPGTSVALNLLDLCRGQVHGLVRGGGTPGGRADVPPSG